MAGQPKTPFYVVLAAGRGGPGGVCPLPLRHDRAARQRQQGQPDRPAPIGSKPGAGNAVHNPGRPTPEPRTGAAAGKAELADNSPPPATTVKTYAFKPAERLPAIKGTSAYKPMKDNTVRFALNVWAGWGPIILANNGFKAGQGLEDARRRGVQGRAGADRRPGRHDRGLRRRAGPHRLGHVGHGAAVRRRHGRPDRQAQGQPRHAPHLTSRSTGPTAATASWSARTSRRSPTCATRSSCWRRTRRRSISR